MRNGCKIVIRKPEGQKLLEDTRIDQRAVCNGTAWDWAQQTEGCV
jgi:hypothetical protein